MPRWLSVLLGLGSFIFSVVPVHSDDVQAIIPLLIAGLVVGAASLVSGLIKGSAANKAAEEQAKAAQAGITAVKEGTTSGLKAQSEATASGISAAQSGLASMQAALAPYMESGKKALASQEDLSGANGPEAQKAAVAAISGGSEMDALVTSGEDAMRQNATATGGLRGGNFQGALAQFRPAMLSNLIKQQYERLGGLTAMGQGSAAQYGAGAVQTGGTIANLYGQQGAGAAQLYSQQGQSIAELLATEGNAKAAGKVATGATWSAIPAAVTSGLGVYMGGTIK
jgi:hypothetical protein